MESLASYASHWDMMFAKETSETREWHTTYQTLKTIVGTYFSHASSTCAHQPLLDIGCGTSTMGLEVYEDKAYSFEKLILLDASTFVTDKLKKAYDSNEMIDVVLGDCRDLTFLAASSVGAILDKGTCDALNDDADKIAMITECLRVLHSPSGVLASISFSSVARLNLLKSIKGMVMERWDETGGEQKVVDGHLKLRVYLIGDGDPARGKECRFLSLISQDFGPVPYLPEALTKKVLTRIEKSGSLTQDDEENVSTLMTSTSPFDH